MITANISKIQNGKKVFEKQYWTCKTFAKWILIKFQNEKRTPQELQEQRTKWDLLIGILGLSRTFLVRTTTNSEVVLIIDRELATLPNCLMFPLKDEEVEEIEGDGKSLELRNYLIKLKKRT
jgi:hypothetical protein